MFAFNNYFKRTPLLLSVILLCIISVINGCKKDSHNDTSDTIADPTVLQAKSWYESTYSINTGKQNTQAIDTNIDWSRRVKPDWNHPASYKRFNDDVIELPLDASSKMAIGLRNTKSGQAVYNPDNSRSSFFIAETGWEV